MWLMTKHGFYSIVEKRPGEFHIRSREAADLRNLIERVPLPGGRVVDTPNADYRARIVADRPTVQTVMRFLADSVDYSNFKDTVDRTPDQCHKPYHGVWDVLAEALGAYGRPGKRKSPRAGE